MNDSELRAKIEELEELAPHVPPAVLAERLLTGISGFLSKSGEMTTKNLLARFRAMSEGRIVRVKLLQPEVLQPGRVEEGSAEIHRRTKAALESAEVLAAHRLEEIGRLEDVLREERIMREERPAPAPILDPGVPARAEDRAAPEISASEPEEEHQAEPAEDTKVCKRCGEEKPLSAFGKHNAFRDGLDNRCKPCRSEMRKTGETSPKGDGVSHSERRLKADATKRAEEEKIRNITVLPPAVRVPEPEEVARNAGEKPEHERKPERFCVNGEDCMAYPRIGRPTKLNSGNKGKVCHGCEERATGRFGVGA